MLSIQCLQHFLGSKIECASLPLTFKSFSFVECLIHCWLFPCVFKFFHCFPSFSSFTFSMTVNLVCQLRQLYLPQFWKRHSMVWWPFVHCHWDIIYLKGWAFFIFLLIHWSLFSHNFLQVLYIFSTAIGRQQWFKYCTLGIIHFLLYMCEHNDFLFPRGINYLCSVYSLDVNGSLVV